MKRNNSDSLGHTMRSLFFYVLLLATQSVSAQNSDAGSGDSIAQAMQKITTLNIQQTAHMQFQYFIIRAAQATFGYDIYADGQLYIHHPNIPAIEGNQGFVDTTQAGMIARVVIQKIKRGEIPPVITLEELKTHHIITDSKYFTPSGKRYK